ncbi:MAG: YmfQ family protein [Lachnospiraceae bacterium]|nr:YmfQ family protein [Lachnospiraceae bacterium]
MFEAPEIIRQIPDIKQIYEINEKQIDKLNEAVYQLDSDIFLEDMGKSQIERWENILNIIPFDDDSIEDRRFRIQTRILERPPYTYRIFVKKLKGLSLESKVERSNNHIIVIIEPISLKMKDEIKRMLGEILPLNLTYCIVVLIEISFDNKNLEQFQANKINLHTSFKDDAGKVVVSQTLRTEVNSFTESIEASVTTLKNAWYFDGTFCFDGEKQFNAEVKKEVL